MLVLARQQGVVQATCQAVRMHQNETQTGKIIISERQTVKSIDM